MTIDAPGFAEPVAQSQACFRAILDAMSRPGRIVDVGVGVRPPAPLDAATAAVLLTLCDADTPLWLDEAVCPARAWLTFHCGVPLVSRGLAALGVDLAWTGFDGLPAGTDEAPESSATLIAQVAELGQGREWQLSGPGLSAPTTLRVDGLPASFAADWHANCSLFPRGVDLILCAGDRLAALPRTVTVERV